MSMIQASVSIAASTQDDDVLANNILSVSRGLFAVDYAIVASATGLIIDLLVGTQTIAPQMEPSLQNRVPVFPDDYNGNFGVIPGDRILLRARNTTGGALTLFFAFRFNPVG